MVRAELIQLQAQLELLRPKDADYLIVAVGVRGPNYDCPEGNAIATIRIGNDEATSQALHLPTAIELARGKILRAREARKRAADEAKAQPE